MDAAALKLNRRLRRLFRSLPDGTLSVVILGGHPRYPPMEESCYSSDFP